MLAKAIASRPLHHIAVSRAARKTIAREASSQGDRPFCVQLALALRG